MVSLSWSRGRMLGVGMQTTRENYGDDYLFFEQCVSTNDSATRKTSDSP